MFKNLKENINIIRRKSEAYLQNKQIKLEMKIESLRKKVIGWFNCILNTTEESILGNLSVHEKFSKLKYREEK